MAKLSNKKLKRIRRLKDSKSVPEIARECNVSEKQVRQVLGEGAKPRQRGADADATAMPDAFAWAFAAIIVAAPLAPIAARTESYDPGNLPQMLFIWGSVTALLAAWLIAGAVRGGLEVRTSPLLPPLGAVAGLVLLSLSWAVNRHDGFFTAFHWLVCVGAFFLTLQVATDRRRTDRLLFALLIAGGVVCLIGVGQRFVGLNIVQQVAPPAATFANKNHAAHFITLTLPVAAALLLRKPLSGTGAACVVVLVLEVVFLVCTRTKAAWLSAMVEAGVFAAAVVYLRSGSKRPWIKRQAKAAAVLACCVGVAWWGLSVGRVGSRGSYPALERRKLASLGTAATTKPPTSGLARFRYLAGRSFAVRTWYWRNSTVLLREHPFLGVGAYNWKIHYPRYSQAVVKDTSFSLSRNPRTPHNDYVQYACEFGVAGLLLAAWLVFCIGRLGLQLIRKRDGWWGIEYVLIPVTAIVGICVNATLSSPLYKAVPPFVLAIYLGLLSSVLQAAVGAGDPAGRATGKPRRVMSRPFLIPAGVLAAVLCVVTIYFAVRFRLADIHYARMTTWSNKGRPLKALEEAAKVVHYNPWRKRVLFYYGRSYLGLAQPDPRKSAAALAELESYYPYSITGMTNLALSYMQMGEIEKVHETADRMIKLFPDPGSAYALKADAYRGKQDLENAIEMYRKAFDAGVPYAEVMCNYASTAWQLEKFDEASRAYKKAVVLKPDWVQIRIFLGAIHAERLGDPNYALDVWRQALELKPTEKEEKQLRALIAKYAKEAAGTEPATDGKAGASPGQPSGSSGTAP